jgi:outer membrane protein assembly factor BamB
MKKTLPLLAPSLLAAAALAAAADWPQWRGPDRNDVSKETGLLKTWPKEGPKLLWTFRDAGEGYSAPAIIGDTLYAMGADDKNENIYAIDLKTQMKKWSTPIAPRVRIDRGDGPRGAVTVDGDLLFGIGSQGDLICVKASNGDKVWTQQFKGKDFGSEMQANWGYSESPLVDGDLVVCTPGGKNGTMAAFNKKNGELVWRTKDWTDKAAYSSIVAADIGGVHQYVQMSPSNVAGVDAKEGKVLWKFARSGKTAAIPTPVVSGDTVFVTSGYGEGCNLIKITKDGDKFKAEEGYSDKDMVNHHGGVVLVDGDIYGYSDGNNRWVCKEMKSGMVRWSKGKDDTHIGKGSLTCADGCLYCYGEDDGTVVLAQASPEGWKEQGRFTVPETSKNHGKQNGGKFWTHPVVANGKLYLRDQDLIFCYDIKDPASP